MNKLITIVVAPIFTLIVSNSHFQFKQFTVWQHQCAMKVTTDGCLFGAIIAAAIHLQPNPVVLDIGCGTGLLSLMIAQQNGSAKIHAVEINPDAAKQAAENINASPWSRQIQITETDILEFVPQTKYCVIVSNPPFHRNQLASPQPGRHLAHHNAHLNLQMLFGWVAKWLQFTGKFFVMLPFYRQTEAMQIASGFGLFVSEGWHFYATNMHQEPFRSVLGFSKNKKGTIAFNQITVKADGRYTEAYSKLLQPYYLQL